MTTLHDIKNYMVKSMSPYTGTNNQVYDDDGHCGDALWEEIKRFWNSFDTNSNKDFEYLVSAKWISDDFDLEGGRSYLLDIKLVELAFDYMVNTLKWDMNDYENIIFNSVDFTDDLLVMFDNDDEEQQPENIILKTVSTKDLSEFIKKSGYLKFHPEYKRIADNNPLLEFVSFSRIDNYPMYKIVIPSYADYIYDVKDFYM